MSARTERELVSLTLLGPAKRGKTSLIAAVNELLGRGPVNVAGSIFRGPPLTGFHGDPPIAGLAERQLGAASEQLRSTGGRAVMSSEGWHSYTSTVEGPRGVSKEIVWLDTIGEALWPLGRRPSMDNRPATRRPRGLRRRFEDLGIGDANHTLVFLLNDAPWPNPDWERRGAPIPVDVGAYLQGVQFARVTFLMACADHLGCTPDELHQRNQWADSMAGTRRLPTAQKHLIKALLATLDRECQIAGASFSQFWSSSHGVLEHDTWEPAEILRPMLWAAGFDNDDIGVNDG